MGGYSYSLRIPKGIEMSEPQNKVQVLDVLTGEECERDMTADEIAAQDGIRPNDLA